MRNVIVESRVVQRLQRALRLRQLRGHVLQTSAVAGAQTSDGRLDSIGTLDDEPLHHIAIVAQIELQCGDGLRVDLHEEAHVAPQVVRRRVNADLEGKRANAQVLNATENATT